MNHRFLAIAFLGTLLVSADWPRFHGPNGSGTGTGPDLPIEFTATKNLLWKVALPGDGNGSPITCQGKVIVSSDSNNGTVRKILCFDSATGAPQWEYSRPGRKARIHRKNSMSSSTPAADGERVVAVVWDGAAVHLIALDLAGKFLWEKDLGKYVSEHGAGMSPVLRDQRVFLVNDHDEKSHVLCFDAKSGSQLWSAPREPHRACYSTPFFLEHDGRADLIVTTTVGITAYNPAAGEVIWDFPWNWSYTKEPLRTVGSSFLANGLIFAHAGNGGGNSHFIALRPPEGGGGKPQLIWERKKGFPYVPSMLVREQWLFTVTDRGVAGCYDAKTGQEVWVERLGGGFSASPVLFRDRVYAISEDGTAYVFQAGPKFSQLARNELNDSVIASPAVADGRLFVRGKNTLYCFGLPTTKVE